MKQQPTYTFRKLFTLILFSVFSVMTSMAETFLHSDSIGSADAIRSIVPESKAETSETETDSSVFVIKRPIPHIYNDTSWINPVLGRRVHHQRLDLTDTLVVPRRSILIPVAESMGVNFGVWAYDHFLFDKGWADINGKTIEHNLKSTWILDKDSYSGNQFSHPFHGSMFYNTARYHGQSYYASALYPLVGSFVWEYFCETNEPSYNDFLSTGIGGSAIGEMTHRVSDIIFDNSKWGVERIFRELIGGFLNPSRGVHRLFSGQMWKRSNVRGKIVEPEPFSVDIGVGGRFLTEFRRKGRHKEMGYVEFTMDYGEHYDEKEHHSPFDYFHVHALLNISGDDPTFSDIFIKGRIATHQFATPGNWKFDLGLYQVYKYIDNYGENGKSESRQNAGDLPFLNEACSFGGGLYLEKVNRRTSFSNDLLVDCIAFGGTTADYYRPRRYNYASGFSITNDIRFCVNNKLVIGDELYFARMYVLKGSKVGDPTDRNNWFWGDKGNNSIIMNKAYIFVNLPYNLRLNAEHTLFYRRSSYELYPHVHAKSQEFKVGLVYSM